MGHARWKAFKYFPHLSKCLLTIRHQQTWLCSSPLDVQRRILPLAAGLRSLLSWSPSDFPTGLLTKTHRHEIEGNFNSTSIYNSCAAKDFVRFLKLHFITSLWPWHYVFISLWHWCVIVALPVLSLNEVPLSAEKHLNFSRFDCGKWV